MNRAIPESDYPPFARRILVLVALGLGLLLAACGGTEAMIDEAYLAAGDGTHPQDLTRTDVLRHDDDLNVVVVLNPHRRKLEVGATFTGPDGSTYATNTLEADSTVGQVVLGLDWEASRNGASWPAGEWTVEVTINDEGKETLTFTVVAPEGTETNEDDG